MTYLRISPQEVKPAIVNLVAGSLKIGQVAVLPTDTIYGFSCLADDAAAIRRIYRLKKRAGDKPLIILVDSLAMLKKYVFVSARQARLLKQIWAGSRPTTVILKHRGRLPRELSANSDGLAVRLPKSKFLIKIIRIVKKPLVSTSLNLSGKDNINNPKSLFHYFPEKHHRPDLVVDTGPCRRRRPSRVIDLRNEQLPLILRK